MISRLLLSSSLHLHSHFSFWIYYYYCYYILVHSERVFLSDVLCEICSKKPKHICTRRTEKAFVCILHIIVSLCMGVYVVRRWKIDNNNNMYIQYKSVRSMFMSQGWETINLLCGVNREACHTVVYLQPQQQQQQRWGDANVSTFMPTDKKENASAFEHT